ncbi:MAG: FtsW/RodA/SpoVE family cell cycle protein, partial [Elusimicrobiota bacterium]
MKRRAPFDVPLISLTLALTALGLMTLYSSSAILADGESGDPFFYLKRQTAWAAAGFISMIFFSRFNVNRLREHIWPLLLLTIITLAAVLFSAPVAGAKRWIRFAGMGFQPAELAKLTVIIFTADYLDRKRSKLSSFTQGMIVPWTVIGLILVLIGLEPDLGTPALL